MLIVKIVMARNQPIQLPQLFFMAINMMSDLTQECCKTTLIRDILTKMMLSLIIVIEIAMVLMAMTSIITIIFVAYIKSESLKTAFMNLMRLFYDVRCFYAIYCFSDLQVNCTTRRKLSKSWVELI